MTRFQDCPDELKAVAFAQEDYESAKTRRLRAIRAAHAAGQSLRAIAIEARLSHEHVRRIVAEQPVAAAERPTWEEIARLRAK